MPKSTALYIGSRYASLRSRNLLVGFISLLSNRLLNSETVNSLSFKVFLLADSSTQKLDSNSITL